ncbi:AraC family transcriptional regulator [Marinobacter orientalis]|uniref:AraC family transcriptional regulator n=1 Tax=Marinobacter orientalis TaxID=1928859 RepID=A0A7Y0RAL8_9GAMM|nr:AraC family transcriptional regulator [Marinobacter orientalis]NMT63074.1 AraC family transcriptional regulator [Marinobacter orientalis]TGX51734.1 AraC family transcriptional regulator [Marinobacter orientalis]
MTKTSQWPVPADSIRYVIPDPVIRSLSRHPLTRDLYPLAFGHYRRAAGHHMHREHHNDDLLIHCTEGEAYLNIEDEPCLVRGGDLVLIPAGAAHRYTAAPDNPWTIHWVHYAGPLAANFREHMGFTDDTRILHIGRQPRLLVDFNGLLSVRQTGFRTPGLVHVANRLRQLLAAVPLNVGEAGHAQQPDLDIIHSFMREHLDERITLGQLADLTGLSPAHFATRYRALTGVSPVQHFLHLKVEQACQLLDTTDHSFTQISSMLGYDDNYYFSRLFKKVMGQSPTDYRHTHRH